MTEDLLDAAQKAGGMPREQTDQPAPPTALPEEPAPDPIPIAKSPGLVDAPQIASETPSKTTPPPDAKPQQDATRLVESILETKTPEPTVIAPPPQHEHKPLPKKGPGKNLVLAILAVILLALPVGVYFVSQQNQQIADIRNRAAPQYSKDVCEECLKKTPWNCYIQCNGHTFYNGWPCNGDSTCKSGYCDGPSGVCQPETRRLCGSNSDCQSGYCHPDTGRCGDTPPPPPPIDCKPGESQLGATSYDVAALACANRCGPEVQPEAGPVCNAEIYQTRATSPGNYKWCWKCKGSGGGGDDDDSGDDDDDTPNPTATPTTGATPVCQNIKIYKDGVQVTPNTLQAGDAVVLAVKGNLSPTKAHFRVNGGSWTESSTKNNSNEFTLEYTVPAGVTQFVIEGEVFTNGAWR